MKQLLATAALTVAVFITAQGAAASTSQHKRIYTRDFITATNIVGKYYGSSVKYWLQSCSASEGGHGGFVWYGHYNHPIYGYSTTPGGWMQFMGGTFDKYVDVAFRDAYKRGLNVHPKARSYYEPLGQAIVAAYVYRNYGSGQWTGAGC